MSTTHDEAAPGEPQIYGLNFPAIVRLANQAVGEAIEESLAAGIPVTGEVDGRLARLHPNGTIEFLQGGPPSVYAELGYADAGEMQRKAGLVIELALELRARRLNRRAAAALLGIQAWQLEQIMRGRFRAVSVAELSRLVRVVTDALPSRPGNCKLRHYTRRQRKRRCVGEYAQTGVDLHLTLSHALDWDAAVGQLFYLMQGLGLEGAGFSRREPCVDIEGTVVFIGYAEVATKAFGQLAASLRAWPSVSAVRMSTERDVCWADPRETYSASPSSDQHGSSCSATSPRARQS